MQVRRLEIAGLATGLAVGAALPIATLHGDPARLLSTFLGLVSASVLPSISLILATMTTGGRSVGAINRLETELSAAMDALFAMLGFVGLVFAAIFTLSLPPPAFLGEIPYLTTHLLPRLGQSLVTAGSLLIVMRAGQVPAILRRSLAIRHEIAVDEARKKTMENVAALGGAKSVFPRDPAFGQALHLSEVRGEASE